MRAPLSALLLCCAVSATPAAADTLAAQKPPVVVELFQSQGCSSCPPADAVLNDLAARPDVIALNFSVTYWDYLGWKDSFAQASFTRRQWDYAKAGGRGNVATPQMIVNGRTELLGSRRGEVDATIARASLPANAPTLRRNGNTVEIGAGKSATLATLWLVRYDPRAIAVPIRAGENGGRTIIHKNIVRQLTALGNWNGQAVRFALPGEAAPLQTVVILQAANGGPVIAARHI